AGRDLDEVAGTDDDRAAAEAHLADVERRQLVAAGAAIDGLDRRGVAAAATDDQQSEQKDDLAHQPRLPANRSASGRTSRCHVRSFHAGTAWVMSLNTSRAWLHASF